MSTDEKEELIIPVRPGITKFLSLENSRTAIHICKRVKVILFIEYRVFFTVRVLADDGRLRKRTGVGEDVGDVHSVFCQRSYRLPILLITDPQVEPTEKMMNVSR